MLTLTPQTDNPKVLALPHSLPQDFPLAAGGERYPRKKRKSRSFPSETAKIFNLYHVGENSRLVSGYFTVDSQIYCHLLKRVQGDLWAVNWADYFQHFFLKVMDSNLTFDASMLTDPENRLYFYWDGQDSYYLYLWQSQTQQYIEGISTGQGRIYFRQGCGERILRKVLVRTA